MFIPDAYFSYVNHRLSTRIDRFDICFILVSQEKSSLIKVEIQGTYAGGKKGVKNRYRAHPENRGDGKREAKN